MISRRLLASPLSRRWSSSTAVATRCFQGGRHPLPLPVKRPTIQPGGLQGDRAWQSTIRPEEKTTGHIVTSPNESIIFVDNIFPLKLSTLITRPWQNNTDLSDLVTKFDHPSLGIMDPINLVKRAIPKSLPIKVTEIIPRLKDGGAFVKFTHPENVPPEEIEESLTKVLNEHPIKPWFNPFRGIKAGLVQGIPWLEDLYRFPKSRLKVEFIPSTPEGAAVELSQETLYSLFRRYGKIAEITSQPSDSKVLPKYALLDFALVRDAIMARNCLHGLTVPEALGGGKNGTKLRLSYEQRVKPHHIWNWISNHPRIVFPIIAALLAAFTVAVFDPIREFFVKVHVQKSFKFSNSRLYKWFKSQTSDIFSFRHQKSGEAGLSALWSHRKDLVDSVNNWLMETTDTFIVIQGPRGSGKKDLVLDQALANRKNVLLLDCKPVVEARGEAGTIKKLASQVGYRPVFSWSNNLSSLIDLAVQSTTGVKAGFSETFESQINKILQTAASALKEVALDERKKEDKDADLSEDAYLEAHPEKRPVVVVNNFLHKGDEKGLVYDKVAEWAAALVQSNIAHVVFLTSDPAYSKTLSKALPDRVFRSLALGDLSPTVAKKYVLSHLEHDDQVLLADGEGDEGEREKILSEGMYRKDLNELDECIESLGGRLTDLNFLARRLKTGQSPKQAVAEIVDQSASDILRMFLLAKKSSSGDQKWSPEQAWYLVRELAAHGTLRYNEVLLTKTFSSSTTPGVDSAEAALESLANAELVAVGSGSGGRPRTVRAGRPVYQAAFKALLRDRGLAARMDLALLTELSKIEARGIKDVEAELQMLNSLPRGWYRAADRVEYLVAKMEKSQAKIVEYDKKMAALTKVLSQEA